MADPTWTSDERSTTDATGEQRDERARERDVEHRITRDADPTTLDGTTQAPLDPAAAGELVDQLGPAWGSDVDDLSNAPQRSTDGVDDRIRGNDDPLADLDPVATPDQR